MNKKKWKKRYKQLQKRYADNCIVQVVGYGKLDLPTQPLREGEVPPITQLVASDIMWKGVVYTRTDKKVGYQHTPDDPLSLKLKVVNND